MIRLDTKQALMVIFSFAGPAGLEPAMTRAVVLLQRYSAAESIATSKL